MRFTFRVSSLSSEQQVYVPWGWASEELCHTVKHSHATEFLYTSLMDKLASWAEFCMSKAMALKEINPLCIQGQIIGVTSSGQFHSNFVRFC